MTAKKLYLVSFEKSDFKEGGFGKEIDGEFYEEVSETEITPSELELFKTILDSLEEDGDYQLEARDFDTLFDLCMKFRLLREDSLKKP